MHKPSRRQFFILGNVGVFILGPLALFLGTQLPRHPKDRAIYAALFGCGTLVLAWIVLGFAFRVTRFSQGLAEVAGLGLALICVAVWHEIMRRTALFFFD